MKRREFARQLCAAMSATTAVDASDPMETEATEAMTGRKRLRAEQVAALPWVAFAR